jgi:hypothetical protein
MVDSDSYALLGHGKLLSLFVFPLILSGLYQILAYLLRPLKSGLRNVPGPTSLNIIAGNMLEQIGEEQPLVAEAWARQYGHVFKMKSLLNVRSRLPRYSSVVNDADSSEPFPQHYEVNTTDLRAINHVLQHLDTYPKPDWLRQNMREILGNGELLRCIEDFVAHKRVWIC